MKKLSKKQRKEINIKKQKELEKYYKYRKNNYNKKEEELYYYRYLDNLRFR